MGTHKGLFLDLLGTLVEDHGFLERPGNIVVKPRAVTALKRFVEAGYVIIVSICRPDMPVPTPAQVTNIEEHLRARLAKRGIPVRFLTEHTLDDSDVRMLSAAMIKALVAEHGLAPGKTFVIGDQMCDVKIGKSTGCRTVLLSSADDTPGFENTDWVSPDYIVEDLAEAAEQLLK